MTFAVNFILKPAKRYAEDESGATAIEYGLIAALIGILSITGASSLGGNLNDKFAEVGELMDGPQEPAFENATAGP